MTVNETLKAQLSTGGSLRTSLLWYSLDLNKKGFFTTLQNNSNSSQKRRPDNHVHKVHTSTNKDASDFDFYLCVEKIERMSK